MSTNNNDDNNDDSSDPFDLSDETRAELEALPNVVGTGIGPRIVDGEHTDEIVLIVFVEQKVPWESLADDERIPETVDGVRTDIQETGVLREESERADQLDGSLSSSESTAVEEFGDSDGSPTRRRRHRPFLGGQSIGAVGSGSGSSSALLRHANGSDVVLTNHHVVAGSFDEDTVGDPINQASEPDARNFDSTSERIGVVSENVLRSPNETNETDSALIELDTSNTASSFGAGFGDLGSPERPTFSGRYVNDGRTTGLTSARLVARDVNVNVNSGGTTLPYRGVDAYENYSRGGDSGSLTARYNASANRAHPTGLHFAGGSDRSFCIPFATVQQYHDIDIPTRSVSKPLGDGTPAYFEITPVIHETRSDGSLDFLVANTGGSSANRTVDIADETGYSLDSKQVLLSAHENTVVSLTPAGVPTGSQTLVARSAESNEQFTAEITTSSVTTTSNPEPGTVRWDTGGEWADIMPNATERTVYHDIGAHRADRVSIGVDPDWLEARNCVLYAPFDETSGGSTTAIDYTNNRNTVSGSLNDGVLTGLSPGIEGTTHFGFTGGQNVNFGNKGYNRSAFSFFAWIWLNSDIQEQDAVIGKYRQDTNAREWFCDIITGDPWRFRYRLIKDPADGSSSFSVNMRQSASFGVNEWVHIGFAVEAGELIRFFKNGQSEGTFPVASDERPAQTNAPLVVGLRDLDYSRYFKGRIDRPILFNRAVSTADANYIYESSKDGQHRTAYKGVA